MADHDWLSIAREAFKTSTTYMDAYLRPEWERSIWQWQSKHAADSKYASEAWKGRSAVFRPKTRSTIRKNEAACAAAFFANQDVVSITPTDDSDEIGLIGAEIMQGIINFRLTRTIPWFMILLGAYQEAQKAGVCISHQYWDYQEGKTDKPCVELIPPENLRIDPASDWLDPINSSPYLIQLIPMYLGDVNERMKRIDPKTGEPQWLPLTDSEIMSASGERDDSTRIVRSGQRADPKEQSNSGIDPFTIVWIRKIVMRLDGMDWLYYTAGGEHLLSDPVPLEQVYHTGMRPYAMGICVLEAFKNYPSSLAELTREVQNEINEVTNQRLDNIKFALNKRYFAKRGAQVDIRSLTRNMPGSVTLMNDPNADVIVHSTPDVTASSFQEQDRLNIDFDDLAGTFSQATVQANRSLNETVGGLNLISDGANQVSEYQLRLFTETWVEPVLRQLVALEKLYETDQVVLRFAGQNSSLFRALGYQSIPDFLLECDLQTNVNVGIGATNPQSMLERFVYGLKALTEIVSPEQVNQIIDLEEIIKEIFGKLGYKDGKRFFKLDGDDPRVQQLMQQIQQLQDELQRKRSPELDAAQAAKLRADATKTNVESAYAAMQAGQVIAMTPGVAPIGDEILASSGWQDQNGPPIATPPAAPARRESYVNYVRQNTSPMNPPVPQQGMNGMQGIETQRPDGAIE